jgi:hypothetical protein
MSEEEIEAVAKAGGVVPPEQGRRAGQRNASHSSRNGGLRFVNPPGPGGMLQSTVVTFAPSGRFPRQSKGPSALN